MTTPCQTLFEYGQRSLKVVQCGSVSGPITRSPTHTRRRHAISREPHGLGQVIPVVPILGHVLQKICARGYMPRQAEKVRYEVQACGLRAVAAQHRICLRLRHPEWSLAAA
ncbi:hypothetical protein D3C77_603060 [compost metagenome]